MSLTRSLGLGIAIAVSLAAAGCGGGESGGSGGGGGGPSEPPADTKDFTRGSGVVTAPVDVDGQPGRLIVDSGAPVVVLNFVDFQNLPSGVSKAKKIVVGDAPPLTDVEVLMGGNLTSPDPKVPINGLLGGTAIATSKGSFDYATGTFALGGAPAPSGTASLVKVPFDLEGGETLQSNGMALVFGKTRVIVTASIDGVDRRLVVDTGSTWSVLRTGVFADTVKDGRATLAGPTIETEFSMPSHSTLTRIGSYRLGGAEAKGVLVTSSDATDTFLDAVAKEVGHDIDGSVGGSFLGYFFASIDYPNATLELSAYDAGSSLVDFGKNIGLTILPDGSGKVKAVLDGTDAAAAGVAAGDKVISIDGQALADVTGSQVQELVSGEVGAVRKVAFGSAKSSAVADKTLSLHVKELLPAP